MEILETFFGNEDMEYEGKKIGKENNERMKEVQEKARSSDEETEGF
jgi:hypothetical protein